MGFPKWIIEDLKKQSWLGALLFIIVPLIGSLIFGEKNKLLAIWNLIKTLFWGLIGIVVIIAILLALIGTIILIYKLLRKMWFFILLFWNSEKIYSLVNYPKLKNKISKKELKKIKKPKMNNSIILKLDNNELFILKQLIEHRRIYLAGLMSNIKIPFKDLFNLIQGLLEKGLIKVDELPISKDSFVYLDDDLKNSDLIKQIINK